MAIDDETRARAMEAVRRRMAGEASDEDMESALGGMNRPAARRAAAKPTDTGDETQRLFNRTRSTPLALNAEDDTVKQLRNKERQTEEKQAAEIRRLQAYDKPLERVEPESFLPPLRGLRAASALRTVRPVRPEVQPMLKGPEAQLMLKGPEARPMLRGPNPMLKGPEGSSFRETVEAAKRRTAARKNASTNTSQRVRSAEEDVMAGEGGPNFRKGGKVSSASSRADGIATKGKTRGRMC